MPGNHPCLTGHFPGNPIVPGMVILEWVIAEVQSRLRRPVRLNKIPVVKFLKPLCPDQAIEIKLDGDDLRVHFRCETGGALIAHGTMEFDATDPKDSV